MTHFYPLTVTALQRETRAAVVLSLQVPDALRERFRFIQGQHLSFRKTIDGEEIRRSYSICSAVQDPVLQVAIKKVPGGVFSSWANEHLKVGEILDTLPPMGHFYTPLHPEQQKYYAGFAVGSGITPILSILKTTLYTEPRSHFVLVYGNRTSAEIMFREQLEDLKNRFLGRLSLVHILSREQQDIALFNGRIDRAKCQALLQYWLDVRALDTVFVCGPQAMMQAVAETLQEQGLDKQALKFELFGNAARNQRMHPARQSAASEIARCEVTVMLDGRSRRLSLEKNQTNLLDAALQQGLELPYACKSGICSTCRAMLVEGKVEMDNPFALTEEDITRGYILCCQSFPLSDKLVVDFDQ